MNQLMINRLLKAIPPLNWTPSNRRLSRLKAAQKASLDRFGDDLVQQIVDYLSLEDRFRLECLSKQIQRVIFESVDHIVIDSQMVSKMKSTNLFSETYFNVQYVSQLLQKCRNVDRLTVKDVSDDLDLKRLVTAIDGQRDNCSRLKHIVCDLGSDSLRIRLIQSFGHLFTDLNLSDEDFDHSLLTLCHNLSSLSTNSLSDVFSQQTNQLIVNNLLKFEFSMTQDFTNEMFATFVSEMNGLRCLKVNDIPRQSTHKERVIQMMSQLTGFRELLQLDLKYKSGSDEVVGYSLATSLTEIGVNLKSLKKFTLRLYTNSSKMNGQTLKAMLLSFGRLKRLDLRIHLVGNEEVATDWQPSMDLLKRAPLLTHFSIHLWDMTNKLLAKLVATLPRLECIQISDKEINFVDSVSLDVLTGLKRLQTLKIDGDDDLGLTDPVLKTLFEKCDQLNQIQVKNDSKILNFYRS